MSLTQPSAAEQVWLEDYAQNHVDLPGANEPWLAERRAQAIRTFERLGLPHRRIESWKYTDLRSRLGALEPATPWRGPIEATGFLADPFSTVGCHKAVFVNGYFRSDLSELPDGIEVVSLAKTRPEWGRAALGTSLSANHPMAAINLALARDGVLIRVPRLLAAARPLHLAFIDAAAEGTARAMHVRNAIVVEEGAQLTLLESHSGRGGAGDLANIVTEILLSHQSRLRHVKLIAEPEPSQHVSAVFAEICSFAAYRVCLLNVCAALARTELVVRLAGREANFVMSAATLAEGHEHMDITTLVEHASPSTTSRQIVKSAIAGYARGIYQGKIIVQEHASGTDSHQLSKSILLSPTAEADTKPELEIYADDVKCGHGATAGALDENALFYLRSRGIPERAATAMLLEAFIEDAIAAISEEDIRAAVSSVAVAKLAHLGGER